MYSMYRFVVDLLQPFTVLYLLLLVGIVLLARKKRRRRKMRFLLATFVLLTLITLPVIGHFAVGSLEWQNPPRDELPDDIDTLVVLSGFAFRPDTIRKEPILAMDSQFRCAKAAYLYREEGPFRILVSGGKVSQDDVGPPLAELMREFLLRRGVDASDIVLESASRNTYENAVETAKLLEDLGVSRIALVTKATHLPRAAGCFRKQGIEVVPVGCDYTASNFNWSPLTFLPRAWAIGNVHIAFHEWLGIAIYWSQGRI